MNADARRARSGGSASLRAPGRLLAMTAVAAAWAAPGGGTGGYSGGGAAARGGGGSSGGGRRGRLLRRRREQPAAAAATAAVSSGSGEDMPGWVWAVIVGIIALIVLNAIYSQTQAQGLRRRRLR